MTILYTTARARFEAARTLPGAADPRLRQRHGHGFVADVWVPQAVSDGGRREDAVAVIGQSLTTVTSRFDYADLDALFATPSDAVIAQAIAEARGEFSDARVTLSPTPSRRVEREADGRCVSACRYGFEAAHYLPHVPVGHKCGRLHGHSFEVLLRAVDVDYTQIDRIWAPWSQLLSHGCLNDIEGLSNPTSECLAQWLWQALRAELPGLLTVTVYETGRCGATFDGSQHSIWRAFTFDTALCRADAPPGDPRRRHHGHTYRLRLHLTGPLDRELGWALDFADVQRLFAPIYDALDHRALATVSGLQGQSAIAVADWILQQAAPLLPALTRVDLEETAGHGVILHAGGPKPFLV